MPTESESIDLHFDAMPGIAASYGRALIGRRPGLQEGGTLAALSATLGETSIDLELLRRYNQLCGFQCDAVLPPTYLHVLAVPLHLAMLTHQSFPLPTFGLVHVAQRIEQHRAIGVNETVALRCHLSGHRPARKGITFDLITEGMVDGELVWRGVTTVLARSRIGREKTEKPRVDPVVVARELGVESWQVGEDLGRRYAAIAKDRNPIHLHALAAKLFGFKRAIIHGMWTMAVAIAKLEESWPTERALFTCTFKRPIFLPSTVEFVHKQQDSAAQVGAAQAFTVWRPGTDKVHLYGNIGTF